MSSRDGSTGRPSRANRASWIESAGEVDRFDRAGLVDIAGLPASPCELGERSWVTRAEWERGQGNSVEPIDESGLVVVELTGHEQRAGFAQLLN